MFDCVTSVWTEVHIYNSASVGVITNHMPVRIIMVTAYEAIIRCDKVQWQLY